MKDPRKRAVRPDSVTLTVVSRQRTSIFKFWRNATFVCAGIFLCCVPFLPGGNAPLVVKIIAITAFAAGVISSIAQKLVKAHRETGTISLRKDRIVLHTEKGELELKVNEITEIYFKYTGYEGENFYQGPRLNSFHTGLENFIIVTTPKFQAGDEVFIKSQSQKNLLENRLAEYADAGISYVTNPREMPAQTLMKIAYDAVSPL